MTELRHRIATGWNAEDIMDKTLDKLLCDIFGLKITVRKFADSQKLIERHSLRSEWK